MKSSNIGGQAVMEGIMMRSGDQYSIGVRKPDGEIEVKVEPYRSWAKDSSIWKLPVFRVWLLFLNLWLWGSGV